MIYYGVVIESKFLPFSHSICKTRTVVDGIKSSAMLSETGTPWTLVRERIKKTYPTVQLTAWTVSDRYHQYSSCSFKRIWII